MAQSSVNIQHHNDILIDLEKKIELLTKGSSSYYRSLFKNLSIKNRDNAKTLYDFLETEHNLQNVKLSTILTSSGMTADLLCLTPWIPSIRNSK